MGTYVTSSLRPMEGINAWVADPWRADAPPITGKNTKPEQLIVCPTPYDNSEDPAAALES